MTTLNEENAPNIGGVPVTKLDGCVTSKSVAFMCDEKHISNFRNGFAASGLRLKHTIGHTQCDTLLRVLQHVGAGGINTPEGVGCGFDGIATRIQELEARGWVISSLRERIIGADGLAHSGIARYCVIGRKPDHEPTPAYFDLGDA